jgi:hypothetical protein
VRAALKAMFRFFVSLLPRAELFPEIDRVNLQILKIDEHWNWNLRRPQSNYRKGPRKCAQRRKSLREQ